MSTPDQMTFLQACGGTGPLLIAVCRDGQAMGSMYRFEQPSILIGRHDRADLRLDDPSVSQRHAYLQLIAGRILCIDLESRTGTLQNRQPISFTWLEPKQTIRIGPYRLNLDSQGRASKPIDLEHWRQSLRKADLEISREGQVTTLWPMPQLIALVGGSQLCHLRLVGERPTRFAFSLVRTPVGVWLVDLGSSNGVQINGQVQHQALLAEADQIPIGPYQVRMRYDSHASRAEPPPAALPSPSVAHRLAKPMVSQQAMGTQPTIQGSAGALVGSAENLLPAVHNLLEQVVQVQQQMSEQLPQAIAMITQAFGTLQRDQLAVVREELAEIRRLNQELVALRSTAGRPRPEPSTSNGSSTAPEPAVTRPVHSDPAILQPVRNTPPHEPAVSETPEPPVPRFAPQEVGNFVEQQLAKVERERRSRWRKLLRALISS